jgi:hypothetical protein
MRRSSLNKATITPNFRPGGWGTINWHEKGPLVIHNKETKAKRHHSLKLIEAENTDNKAAYERKWRAGQAMCDMWRDGKSRKDKPPSWEVHWKKNFKLGRKVMKIEWTGFFINSEFYARILSRNTDKDGSSTLWRMEPLPTGQRPTRILSHRLQAATDPPLLSSSRSSLRLAGERLCGYDNCLQSTTNLKSLGGFGSWVSTIARQSWRRTGWDG